MNCIIIHGCTDSKEDKTYNKHWMPWIKKELIKRKIPVEMPIMPKPWVPDYDSYKKEFEKYKIDENTILIGHSCGCAFLVRWLGESKQKVKKLILVAPWKIPEKGNKTKEKFYNFKINPIVKSLVNEIIMFTADDEEEK